MKKTYSFTIDDQVMEQIRKAAEADGRHPSASIHAALQRHVISIRFGGTFNAEGHPVCAGFHAGKRQQICI